MESGRLLQLLWLLLRPPPDGVCVSMLRVLLLRCGGTGGGARCPSGTSWGWFTKRGGHNKTRKKKTGRSLSLRTHNDGLFLLGGVSDDYALDLLVETLNAVPETRSGWLGYGDGDQDGLRHRSLKASKETYFMHQSSALLNCFFKTFIIKQFLVNNVCILQTNKSCPETFTKVVSIKFLFYFNTTQNYMFFQQFWITTIQHLLS